MKDTKARRIAVIALFAAIGAFMLGSARADSTTEPDAAALAQRVAALETQVDALRTWQRDVHDWQLDKDATTEQIIEAVQPIDCMAFSTYHGFRETIGPKGRKYHTFPIMLWNVTAPGCKPSPVEFRKRIARVSMVLASR